MRNVSVVVLQRSRDVAKTVANVVITDCWCVCSGTLYASASEREREEEGGGNRKRERESYLFTQYIASEARLIDLGKWIPCQDITLT